MSSFDAEALRRARDTYPDIRADADVVEVTPPRLGLRGVNAFTISEQGDAYAYSYGQELSRLYSMTVDDLA